MDIYFKHKNLQQIDLKVKVFQINYVKEGKVVFFTKPSNLK